MCCEAAPLLCIPCTSTLDPLDSDLAQLLGLHHSAVTVQCNCSIKSFFSLCSLNDQRCSFTISSSSSSILHRLTVLHFCSPEINQGQLLLFLVFFLLLMTDSETHSGDTAASVLPPYIDGRLTAYFCCTNLGAGRKCQLCDTNIPHQQNAPC